MFPARLCGKNQARRKSGLALRADAGKFQAMPENLERGQFAGGLFHIEIRGKIKVVNPAALTATHMVVDMGRPVETFLGAADIQFLDDPALGHDLKVAVDRAQADFGQTFAHHLVKHVGSGMRGHAAQLIENDLALFGYPQAVVVELRHDAPPYLIIILTTGRSRQSQDFFGNFWLLSVF
jgi:hypothetical protein